MHTETAQSTAARDGCRAASAVTLAYVPFGLAVGATLAATSVDTLAAWSSSWLILGAAAQLVAVQLLDTGTPAAVVVLAALVVNARHLLYSASLAPHADDWPRRWRWLAPYFLTDPVFALALARYQQPGGGGTARQRLDYYLGMAVTGWAGWQLATGAGVFLAGALPTALPLDLAAPLTFLLLLLPVLTNRAGYAAAAVGGTVALVTSALPLGFELLAGAAAGMLAGWFIGGRHA